MRHYNNYTETITVKQTIRRYRHKERLNNLARAKQRKEALREGSDYNQAVAMINDPRTSFKTRVLIKFIHCSDYLSPEEREFGYNLAKTCDKTFKRIAQNVPDLKTLHSLFGNRTADHVLSLADDWRFRETLEMILEYGTSA